MNFDPQDTGIRITGIRPDTLLMPGAPPQEGYRVEFVTPSGIHSYVKVPRSENLEQLVHGEVKDEAERLEAAKRTHQGNGLTTPVR